MKHPVASIAVLSFAMCALIYLSGSGRVFGQPDKEGISKVDRDFMTEAAQGGMAEVKLGQLAADKGNSADVKRFGQQMVDDHGKANQELMSLAQTKNVTLPTDLGKHQKTYDKLQKLSGDDFDKAYIKDMVEDHKDDVKAFQKQAERGQDRDVKEWAAKTLPTLQDHLKMAQDMQDMRDGKHKK